MAGYGIKVQTNTGHRLWVTCTGVAKLKTAKGVMKFESEAGAEMYRTMLAKNNPTVTLSVAKL